MKGLKMNLVKASGSIGKYVRQSKLPSGIPKIEFILIVESNYLKNTRTGSNQISYVSCQAFGANALGLSNIVKEGRKLTINKGELATAWKTVGDEQVPKIVITVQEFLFK
ncbi:MAG: single-stranded DNA-binding protein [Lactococcus plantarum]|nr:single-stranded DNA-binding protein [Lactococcus plantarum]